MRRLPTIVLPLLIIILLTLLSGTSQTSAGGTLSPAGQSVAQTTGSTAFTFHGQLAKDGTAYTGLCNLSFGLWDSLSGGAQLGGEQAVSGVSVSDGVFAVVLNELGQFGPTAFNGGARWLDMQVQCAGDATPVSLGRQAVLSSPYALYATRAESAAVADSATTATRAESAAVADTATSASRADSATTADSADSATNADHATTADTATNAGHATSADTAASATRADSAATAASADHATSADSATTATRADSAATADSAASATNADHATSADTATSATRADSAATADSADSATNADHATSADTAASATRADSADTATNATRADSAATADSADSATNADHATSADTATSATRAATADTATTAASANSVAASAGTSTIAAINDAATTGTISSSRLSSDVLLLTPGTPQLSVGDSQGTGAMINLQGGSTCCGGGATGTPAYFKVFQDGSLLLTSNLGIGLIPTTGKGDRMMWYGYRSAFRAGRVEGTEWDDANMGFFSWAGGYRTQASETYSLAFGDQSVADGQAAIALGSRNYALGDYSVALGQRAATGACSGTTCTTSSTGHSGAFVFADNASSQYFSSTANNEFAVRASGGFRFRTSADASTGCNLAAGSGAFACTSDQNQKENFTATDGEAVLAHLAAMDVQEWNYKDDPLKSRHVGPTAQEFYATFGLGSSDTEIGLLDVNGVNMVAIQALERRTREVAALEARVAALETQQAEDGQQLDELAARLTALEAATGMGAPVSSGGLTALWTFLAGAAAVGLAFGAYRLGIRRQRA